MTAVGSAMIRRDARVRATGAVQYTDDITLDGMLHGVLVRSAAASGRIVAVDTEAALGVDGVVRILTAADVTDRRYGNYVKDQPILAGDVVRYVGEPVAIVAATTIGAARRAAALTRIEIEPLPFVVDLEAAASTNPSSVVHDGPDNVVERVTICRGDPESAFSTAHLIVNTRVDTHRVHQGYLEPRAVIAVPTNDGLSITMSSQQPFGVRLGLAELFDLAASAVDVHVPAIGGGFGGKLHLGLAPQAAAAALATGLPVKLVCTRDEDMQNGNPRENSIVEVSSAVDADGTVRARRCTVLLDAGAYALDTPARVHGGVLRDGPVPRRTCRCDRSRDLHQHVPDRILPRPDGPADGVRGRSPPRRDRRRPRSGPSRGPPPKLHPPGPTRPDG